jgi:hypothetical protein
MDTHAEPEQTRHDAIASGLPIGQLFRDVIADRLPSRRPPQAAMLFDVEIDPLLGRPELPRRLGPRPDPHGDREAH